ncbi:rCG50422, isoform CRA_e [Rattus norvegicus]|uniref:RCG50422, isoform CRA_e n=1 Tax=Rattus norvegicus TaxID=10116 RepID=A6JZH1_RAT|nr:rCG50422, isoform CRA_e [Rattus norvegicus]
MRLRFWLRRTSWDCWSPLTRASQTPSISWTLPSRRQPSCRRLGDPICNCKWTYSTGRSWHGNLTGNIREFLPIVGHVQVAQVPDRGEPGSSGELDFTYLFQLLEDEGYQGFVGCEYRPRGDTVEGLSWLRSYWDRWGHPRTGQ